jgi:peptidyl-prolyl cis-trans isomerase SurA
MKALVAFFLSLQMGICIAENTIIAVVNNNIVTLQSVEESFNKANSFEEKILLLNYEIDLLIQLDKANQLGIEISENDIFRAIKDVADYNNISLKEFQKHPQFYFFRNEIITNLKILKLQSKIKKNMQIEISNQELNNICKVNPDIKKQIKIAQIIITNLENVSNEGLSQEQSIKKFLTKLSNHISKGASFEGFAKLHSQHPSYVNGGISNWLFINNDFLEAIDKLGKNEVSRIYQMEYGWAIAVKTDERFIDINFINCEEDLINTKRNTIYDEWLKTLKDSSNIEIFSNKFD